MKFTKIDVDQETDIRGEELLDRPTEDQELKSTNPPPLLKHHQPTRKLGITGAIAIGVGIGMVIGMVGMSLIGLTVTKPEVKSTADSSKTPTSGSTQTVTVAKVETATIDITLDATGTVAAYDLLPVLPQASGLQIKQVLVDDGDVVETGQIMAILDDAVLRSQIDQAKATVESNRAIVKQKEAALSQAQATLEQSLANKAETEANLEQAQATLAQSQTKLAQAEVERKRYQDLSDQGAISRQEGENRTTDAATAQETVHVAQANISSAKAKISSAQANITNAQANIDSAQANLNSAQADVRSSQARVQQLETQQEQTLVRSPSQGIIAERIARIGDVSSNTQKLFSIIKDGRLELQAKIPETQLAQIKIGAGVRISSDADSRIKIQGTVREIAALVDAQNRLATVKIDLPASNILRPGMFLRAAIKTNSTLGIAIPVKSVLPQNDGSGIVYRLVGEDKVQAQKVQVGEIISSGIGDLANAKVAIKSGLELKDQVVVSGAGYLKDGDRVKIVSE